VITAYGVIIISFVSILDFNLNNSQIYLNLGMGVLYYTIGWVKRFNSNRNVFTTIKRKISKHSYLKSHQYYILSSCVSVSRTIRQWLSHDKLYLIIKFIFCATNLEHSIVVYWGLYYKSFKICYVFLYHNSFPPTNLEC
jgi:hypothetical protein